MQGALELLRAWYAPDAVLEGLATVDGLPHLRDALAAVQLPAVEVHITNVHQREDFRHHSFLSPVCAAVIVGAGVFGYKLAIDYLAETL